MSPMSVPTARTRLQQLAEQLAREVITPRAAADEALKRANSNASHNVYIALDAEKVREHADELPRRFPHAAKPLLYGVPVSIKDCFDVAGFPTSLGSRYYAERDGVAREDSALTARLRSQGAIIIGKTHMHTLAYGITGENPDYGDCVQPRDARRLTGGFVQRRGGQCAGAVSPRRDRNGHWRLDTSASRALRACGISCFVGLGPPERIVARRRASGAYVRHAGLAVPGSTRRAAVG